jgi:hypothetical protein
MKAMKRPLLWLPLLPCFCACLGAQASARAQQSSDEDWYWWSETSAHYLAADGATVAGLLRYNGTWGAAVSQQSGRTIRLPDYGEPDNVGQTSAPAGVSANGRIVGGTAFKRRNNWPVSYPVQWIDGTLREIRIDGSQPEGWISGVADDGLCIGSFAGDVGFICEPGGDPSILEVPQGVAFNPSCISRNGSVIAGYAFVSGNRYGATWDNGSLAYMPDFVIAEASDNGIIVGETRDAWPKAVFTDGDNLLFLPHPNDQFWNWSRARAISADGRYIVGEALVTYYAYGQQYDIPHGVLWEVDGFRVVNAVNIWGSTQDAQTGLPMEGLGVLYANNIVLDPNSRAPIIACTRERSWNNAVGCVANLSENIVAVADEDRILSVEFETSQGVLPDPGFESPDEQLRTVRWLQADSYNRLLACNTRVRARLKYRYVGLRKQLNVRTSLYIAKAGLVQEIIDPDRDFLVATHLQSVVNPGQVIEWSPQFIPESSSWRLRSHGIFGRITVGFVLDADDSVTEVNEDDNLNTDVLTYREKGLALADPTFWYRVPSQAELTDRYGVDSNGQPVIRRSYDTESDAQAAMETMGYVFLDGWRRRARYAEADYCPFDGRMLSLKYYDVGAGILEHGGRYYIMFQDFSRRAAGFPAREPSVLAVYESPLFNALWAFYVYRFHMLY